jgi:CheY-like chemotaxis protein
MLLDDWGYGVTEARDGQEAWELLEQAAVSVDAVLLDVNMPRLGGEALLARLRRDYPSVQVIMMSSEADEVRRNALNLGASSFLVKPFRPAELRNHIDHALGVPLALPPAAIPSCARPPEQIRRMSSL